MTGQRTEEKTAEEEKECGEKYLCPLNNVQR